MLEVLNAGLLLVWALAVLDDRLIALPLYSTAFRLYESSWANEAVSAVFFVALLFALTGIRRHGGRYDVLAGYALQLSALLVVYAWPRTSSVLTAAEHRRGGLRWARADVLDMWLPLVVTRQAVSPCAQACGRVERE